MQIENRLKNHYRRWNIVLDPEEEFSKFKTRLINVINENIGDYLAENLDIDRRFKEYFDFDNPNKPSIKKSQPIYREGHPMNPNLSSLVDTIKTLQPDSYTKREFGDTHIYKCIIDCGNLKKLATVLQITFWALEINHDDIKEAL